jgi:protein-S-isoprenylcysteine O-methyltransferase Ste14
LEVVLKIIVFVVVSLALAYLSRASLRHPRAHGFYRFFAWEAIAGLFLLNVQDWFCEPFSVHQLLSWLLLVLSGVLVVHGVSLLRHLGKPSAQRVEAGLIGLEKTTALVEVGAFRYIRHPLYCSLLLLAWGIFFKAPSLLGSDLAIVATVFLWLTARVEERENFRYFGSVYQDYKRRTWMFIPFLF